MKYPALFFVVIFLSLIACRESLPEHTDDYGSLSPSDSVQPETSPLVEKPFELASHLYLRLGINDSIFGTFLFDSGANGLILDRRFAQQKGLVPKDQPTGSSYTYGVGEGKLKHGYAPDVTVVFDKKIISVSEPRLMPLDSLLRKALNHTLDGIIGADVFKDYLINMDFDSGTIRLDSSLTSNDLGSFQRIPYRLQYRKPMIKIRLTLKDSSQVDGKVIFDMGSGRGISLTHQKGKDEQLFQRIDSLDCTKTAVGGIGGHSNSCDAEVAAIHIGEVFNLTDITIELGKDENGALGLHTMYDGLMGMEIIQQFNLIMDQENKHLYLRKRVPPNHQN